MSDLIERLRKWGNSFGLAQHYLGTKSAREDCAEAATALAEAQATIARQQVMLDRALEASFDDKARADRAEAENARLRGESRALRAMIRVNLLRYGPSDLTHQEIDREIEIAVNPPPLDAKTPAKG